MDMELLTETIERLRAERKRLERSIVIVCARMPVRNMKLVTEAIARLRTELEHIEHDIAAVYAQMPDHVSEDDLERYHLGMVKDDELAALEEHLLWCVPCIDRAEENAQYVDTIRAAACQIVEY